MGGDGETQQHSGCACVSSCRCLFPQVNLKTTPNSSASSEGFLTNSNKFGMQTLWWDREAENGDGAGSMSPAFIQFPLLSSSGNLSGAASNSPPFILLDVNGILVH